MGTKYKVIVQPVDPVTGHVTELSCKRVIQKTIRIATDLLDWYIKLEMVQGKHDKFYIIGGDSDGLYLQYGRNGTQGRRCAALDSMGLAYKLFEKIRKGYVMTTDIPTWEKPFPVLFNGVDVSSLMVGSTHNVDLSIISPMFKMVEKVKYENNQFRALNGRDKYVMTIPTSVIADYLKGEAS